MKKKNLFFTIIMVGFVFLMVIIAISAAFKGNNDNMNVIISNNVTNNTTENKEMKFQISGGLLILNTTENNAANTNLSGNQSATNTTALTINYTANSNVKHTCTYDVTFEWTSNDKYFNHSSNINGKEFTVQANLTSNPNVTDGVNGIASETDLADVFSGKDKATVISQATISSTGENTSTATWAIIAKIYSLPENKETLSKKSFSGRFKVTNISCKSKDAQ